MKRIYSKSEKQEMVQKSTNPTKDLMERAAQDSKKRKTEAFRAGKSAMVVDRVGKILTRRTGTKTVFGKSPVAYESMYGRFLSYIGYFGSTKIRINFLIGGNEQIASFDVFGDSGSLTPEKTIDLLGNNIVQVLAQVADILTGDFEQEYLESISGENPNLQERKLEERAKLWENVAQWLLSDPLSYQEIDSGRANWDDMADRFLQYARNELGSKKTSVKVGALQHNVHLAIQNTPSLGGASAAKAVPTVAIKQGVPTQKALPADPDVEDAFSAFISDSPASVMADMEAKARLVGEGHPMFMGMYVYGRPGTGKTFRIIEQLDDVGADYEVVAGGIDGFPALIQILYKYKDDKVIVFDDNDSVFGSAKMINMLKIALHNKPVGELGIDTEVRIPKTDIVIPEKFKFTSRVIFISNMTTMNPAIQSRLSSAIFAINFSTAEMIDLVKSKLKGIRQDMAAITDDMREDAIDFVIRATKYVVDFDFRRFEGILAEVSAARDAGLPDATWKKAAIKIMQQPKLWSMGK